MSMARLLADSAPQINLAVSQKKDHRVVVYRNFRCPAFVLTSPRFCLIR
jgi:hypothetical protein